MMRIPAAWQRATASATSGRGGSKRATSPRRPRSALGLLAAAPAVAFRREGGAGRRRARAALVRRSARARPVRSRGRHRAAAGGRRGHRSWSSARAPPRALPWRDGEAAVPSLVDGRHQPELRVEAVEACGDRARAARRRRRSRALASPRAARSRWPRPATSRSARRASSAVEQAAIARPRNPSTGSAATAASTSIVRLEVELAERRPDPTPRASGSRSACPSCPCR